jgi:hypothetical protein
MKVSAEDDEDKDNKEDNKEYMGMYLPSSYTGRERACPRPSRACASIDRSPTYPTWHSSVALNCTRSSFIRASRASADRHSGIAYRYRGSTSSCIHRLVPNIPDMAFVGCAKSFDVELHLGIKGIGRQAFTILPQA